MKGKMLASILALCLMVGISAADFTLHVYGNANMDDVIDERDIEYVRGIIDGRYEITDLADANRDGVIDEEDIAQIEAIINSEEKVLWILDGNGEPVAVHKPVERIVVEYLDNAELVHILGSVDKVVGVEIAVAMSEVQFPELSTRQNVGRMSEPDYEAVLSVNPDILLTFSPMNIKTKATNLPGVDVIFLGLYYPDLLNIDECRFTDGVMKLGYILDAEDRAKEYVDWRLGWIDLIRSRTENLADEEKPKVLISSYQNFDTGGTVRTYSKMDTLTQMSILAGGKNLAEDLPDFFGTSYRIEVDPEWVIEEDPEIIVLHSVSITYGGAVYRPANGFDTNDPTEMREAREDFMNNAAMSEVSAVKSGNVYLQAGSFRNDATGGLIGAAYMAKAFHPDIFEDLDPEIIFQEYLDRFAGHNYNLDEQGIFFYPPIVKGKGQLAGIPDRYYESLVLA
jgi:iron complex transport system substrate-binding protein